MNVKRKYRILIIEPSEIVAAGLQQILNSCRDFTVVATISDLSHYNGLKDDMCDMILLDPSVVGHGLKTDIRACLPLRIDKPLVGLMVGLYDDSVTYQYDTCIGLYDSWKKIEKKLHIAIEAVSEHPQTETNELSARERSVLAAVAQGKTNKEIADELNLSVYTVVTHRKNISHKLGINSIAGLTVYAMMNKIIDINI